MKFTKLAIAMMSTAALAACGGGGGSGSSGNNNVQPDPNPNPENEQGSVVQAFQFDAFSSQDVADAVTRENFNENTKTVVCLAPQDSVSCFGQEYQTEGVGLSFSGNLEWPDSLDTAGMNILAENNEFTYSIPADSGKGAVAQGTSSQRVKVYINPVTNAGSDSRLGSNVLLQKYDGDKYTKVTFDPTTPYSKLDQEIKTLGDTVTSMVQSASAQSISDADLKNIVSGALGAIIEALKDSGVSDVQIVINVVNNQNYDNLPSSSSQEGNSAPVASFTFEVGADGWVTFTNSSSDPDNDNLTYKWKFGDGAESSEVSPKHQYTRNGSFSVYLGASDDKNAVSYATKHVNVDTVSAADQEAASFTVTAATDGSGKVTVANASTVENVREFRWDFGDGTGAVSGENPDHTYAKSGSYTVKLQIITKTGVKFTDSHTVSVTVNSVTPVNPDPVNPDPVNPDPVNPDPVNPDPVNPDPVNPDPVTPSVCTDSDPYCKGNIDPEGCEQQCTEQQVEVDCSVAGSQSVASVQSAADVSSEALSSIEMAGIYATNPNGQVGKNKTISSMSDWTSDMLIAQGAANDDPRAYRGYHEKSVDLYGLYAAWDDTNLYLMVELPNLDERGETGSDFDYSNDKFLPMGIGIRTGKRVLGDGEMEASSSDRLPWIKEKVYSIKEGVDALLMFHPQEYGTPGLFLTNNQGEFSYDSKGGYLVGFKDVGIELSGGVAGSVSSKFMGIADNYGKDGNAWKTGEYTDLKASNANNPHLYQVTIPLSALGIDKAYLESTGISAMVFSTFGTSMMDALPWTPNLVDKASEAYSQDDSTSAEKEDVDIYDVHLASIGKLQTGGVTPVTPVTPVNPDPISPDPQVCYQKKIVCVPETLPAQCNSTDAIEVSLSHSESTADAAVTTAVKVATGYKGVTYKWSTSDGQSATTSYDGTSKSFTFKRGKADKTVTVTVTASNSSGSRTGTQSFTVSVPACANCSAPAPVDNAWVNVLDQVDSNIYVDNGTASTCKAPEGAVILKHDGFANPTLWLYQDKTNYTGGTWPGASMTKIDGCTSTFYSFTPSESVSSASAIFSDAGNNQYPGQNQPGVEFTTAKPCFDYEAKAFKSADECGLAAAEVTDSAYIFVDGSKKTDGVITISQKDDSEASGYKDISLMMAGKGVNAETTGTFYFGDDASKAAEFVNGQKIRVGENITATEEGTETKLTVIYKDSKATYTIKKVKWTAPVVGDVQFSWNNAYMYFVITDRFQNGDSSNDNSYDRPKVDASGHATATFHGGDIKGLTDRLDYIKSLGINAIWLTAPYEQTHGWVGGGSNGNFQHYAYHGYYAMDFTSMDANMGTVDDFRKFVTEAHKRGIRVVVDVVMNHSGYPTLKDMCEFKFGKTTNGTDPCSQVNWTPGGGETYHQKPIDENPDASWNNWWGQNWLRFGAYGGCGSDDLTTCTSYLPDFKNEASGPSVGIPGFLQSKWQTADAAHDVPAAKQYRSGNMSVADFEAHWLASWVEEFGVDGFRCDTAKHVQKETWGKLKKYSQEALQKWRQAHAGGDDPAASWTDDFYMTGEHWGFGTDPSDGAGYASVGGFTSMINFSLGCSVPSTSTWSEYAQKFNNGTSAPKLNALTYVSSHDTKLCRPGDQKALGTGLGLLPGGVQVYYGDETARPNDNGGSGNDAEHGTRSDMNFPSDIGSQAAWAAKVDTLSTEFSSDANVAHWQKVGQFRFRNPAVGAGKQTSLSDGSLCRTYNDGQGIDNAVVIHVGSASSVDVSGCFEDGTELQDGYSGATGTVSGGKVSLSGTKDLILLELKR
ncbi:alpha-amylase family glycosyl hydrolase [Succinimonas sp.]|uniref:alpha-amylase family glycosyl hydrolase n=1 Tax=Succinimonas sp. TaxID=1936151 RepID=UPI003867E1E5